jgi:hypothetical protein
VLKPEKVIVPPAVKLPMPERFPAVPPSAKLKSVFVPSVIVSVSVFEIAILGEVAVNEISRVNPRTLPLSVNPESPSVLEEVNRGILFVVPVPVIEPTPEIEFQLKTPDPLVEST